MEIRLIQISLIIACSFALATGLAANDQQFNHAQNLLDDGRIFEAELVYKNILLTEPSSIEANIGLAIITSWAGDYQQAEFRYRNVLRQQPDHLQAMVGLGYTLAWSGQLEQAEATFDRAAQLAPANFDVEKGTGFIALWRKDSRLAISRFEKLVALNPDNTELLIALGQAHLLNLDGTSARDSFQAALTLEPGNRAARDGYREAHSVPSKLEVLLLYGSNDEDTGLRQIEIGSWLNRRSRLWIRYDDSLSLDAHDMSRGDAENLLLGYFHEFNSEWLGSFEFGKRDLPDDKDQDIYGLELVHLQAGKSYKLGLQTAPHSDDFTDQLTYASYGYPADENWRIVPTLYLSRTGLLEDENWLLLTHLDYQSDALWGAGFGIGFGETKSELPEFDGSVTTASVKWFMPISTSFRISLLINHEDRPASDRTSVILGFNWRLQKGRK